MFQITDCIYRQIYRFIRLKLSFTALILLLSQPAYAGASGEDPDDADDLASLAPRNPAVQSLQRAALSQSLHSAERWRRLLHYPQSRGSGGSAITTSSFFFSPRGSTSAGAEMLATIAAFYQPANGPLAGASHPQCRFPARFRYLAAHLKFASTDLPSPDCSKRDSWLAAANDGDIAIVMSGYATDDPVGRLGHIFLKTNAGKSTPLDFTLNYALNFPDGEPGYLKVAGSLTGAYSSKVFERPYYYYRDSYEVRDLRDIWTYTLALADLEKAYVLEHVWELRDGAELNYKLFTQNCVTFFMAMIELARPGLDLYEGRWVFPSDAVKALNRVPKLVKSVNYEPSAARVLEFEYAALTGKQKTAFHAYLAGDESRLEKFSQPDRIPVYRVLSTELLIAMRHGGDVTALRVRRLKVLAALRGANATTSETPVPAKPGPESGHGNSRVFLGAGRLGDASYARFEHRALLHGRLDRDDGYATGDVFEALDLSLRYYPLTHRTLVDELAILNVESFPSVSSRNGGIASHVRASFLGSYPDPAQPGFAFALNQRWGAALYNPVDPRVLFHATGGYYAVLSPKLVRKADLRPDLDTGAIISIIPSLLAADAGATFRPAIFGGYRGELTSRAILRYLPFRNANVEAGATYLSVARRLDWRLGMLLFY